ncbi:MAG: DUF2817 domain-containing protein [Spirochaetes bacterium]|nr:DUF2817 domain-containing protein [Spirochaetota bacterium]
MRLRKVPALSLVTILMIGLSCSGNGHEEAADPSLLPYFQESYGQCRAAFLARADELKRRYPAAEIRSYPLPAAKDSGLFIDSLYIPAGRHRDRLLVVLTGVHGVEGFAGSAVAQLVMKEMVPKWDLDRMGVLILHAINPWGFKNHRRVTERNVDLNRNFGLDRSVFETKNEGYASLQALLDPEGKADPGSLANRFFPLKAVYYIVKYSMKTLREAVLRGQYRFERGIYFGGRDFEPQKEIIDRVVLGTSDRYRSVFVMEVHTGYGERGTMHLFPDPVKSKRTRAAMERIFRGYHVDWGDTGDFYTTTGDLIGYLEDAISPKRLFIPMFFEFGTMDSQTTLGSIRSIQNVILENQGVQRGYESDEAREEVGRRFLEAYYPPSPEWRSRVLRQVREQFPVFVERYASLPLE